jgi:hypothetical protein
VGKLNIPVTPAELVTVVTALEEYYSILMKEAPDPNRDQLRVQVVDLILKLEGHVPEERK